MKRIASALLFCVALLPLGAGLAAERDGTAAPPDPHVRLAAAAPATAGPVGMPEWRFGDRSPTGSYGAPRHRVEQRPVQLAGECRLCHNR